MKRAAMAMMTLCLGCGGREPVCKSMYKNSCNHGCECPDGYECAAPSDGDLTFKGQNRCYKDCTAASDCPADHRCTAKTVSMGGGARTTKGQCAPECLEEGSAQACPPSTSCQSLPAFPDGDALLVCE